MEKNQYIEAGKIVNTHGVRGEVKIQVWLDSPEFLRGSTTHSQRPCDSGLGGRGGRKRRHVPEK